MRKFYLKFLFVAYLAIAPLALFATDVILLESTFDFGETERANITSTMTCHFVNQGTDTVFVQYFTSFGLPFAIAPSSNSIAPGDTLEGTVSLHRWADEGNHSSILEISFADDTLALNVTGSIVDNTPTFSPAEVSYWVGSGVNFSILVVDFNNGWMDESVAFGYKFNGSVSAQSMIQDIAAAYPDFTANIGGGFLMDITYGQQVGLAGNPEWWMTTTRTDSSLWQMNFGISTTLNNGDWFGCTYSPVDANWNPTNLPGNPVPAPAPTSIFETDKPNIKVYPNPTTDFISLVSEDQFFTRMEIIDMTGKIWPSEKGTTGLIDVCHLPEGMYTLLLANNSKFYSATFIKQ